MKTIAFFNHKDGVGKTTLLYHLAWMYADLGLRVIAVDLDPQCDLSSMFLEVDRLDEIWNQGEDTESISAALRPLIEGTGGVAEVHVEMVTQNFGLIVGNLSLSKMEDEFCCDGKERALRFTSAFFRVVQMASKQFDADLVLIDVGSNLGAINRSAVLSADYVVIPIVPDVFSLRGLRDAGATLRNWRTQWESGQDHIPSGTMKAAGYILMQYSAQASHSAKGFLFWSQKIPSEYRRSVLGLSEANEASQTDPNCLAVLKRYSTMMSMAMEARKPVFHLTPYDGAIGSHSAAVRDCYADFKRLAQTLAAKCDLALPVSQR